jgi:deoxyribodipyrimidine photo-lyase
MQILVDGDLASNNGGWQWSASTGTDAAPYFRIFNPYNQSTKVFVAQSFFVQSLHLVIMQADPCGEFIRYWVPELAKLRGDGEGHDVLYDLNPGR